MLKGVDIGGSFVKVLWENGRREKYSIREVKSEGKKLKELLSEIILSGNPTGVGIAVAGFTSREGILTFSPNIPILNGLKVRDLLLGRDIPLEVGNDVTLGSFGEWYYDHRDSRVLVLVAVGTGLGGGLVIEGKPFFGAGGSAMEIGHHLIKEGGRLCSCGRRGCWEAYCSSYGLSAIYGEIAGTTLGDREIINRALKGEATALRAVEEFKEHLLTGLMNLVHILNPDRLVLGGGVIEGMKELLGDLEERLKERVESLPGENLRLVFSRAGEFMGARGALAFIKSRPH
jgi:glucokinase